MSKTTLTSTMTTTAAAAPEFLPIEAIDHIEFYVGNALQAAQFYRHVFGFNIIAYRGLETGSKDKACYVLEQGQIRFVLTSALSPDHEVARHCQLHGDGVRVVGFRVNDVDSAIAETRKRGATVVQSPETHEDKHG